MILKTNIKVTRPYCGTTKFDFWKEITPDDIIEVSMKVRPYYSRANLSLKNMRNGEVFTSTMTIICDYLSKIEYEEV